MSSTPELSPSPDPTSEDDDHPFFPALLTSADHFPQQPAHASPGSLKPEVHPDISLIQEGETYPYTQKPRYPTPFDSQIPPSDYFTIPQFEVDRSHTIAALTSIDISASGPESCNDPHLCAGNGSPTATTNGQFSRAHHPSFIKFPDTLPLNKPQLHGLRSPHPRCLPPAMGTEALISLAWTGEISSPIVASGYVRSPIGDTYMWPKLKISDTEMIGIRRASWHGQEDCQTGESESKHSGIDPRCPEEPSPPPKRWTLSTVMSDDQVTDEIFVQLLEELRSRRSTARSTLRFLPDPITPIYNDPESLDGINNDQPRIDPATGDISKAWLTARRTLLVCRELIRTERHYLSSLKTLTRGETQSPVPPLMLSRLPPLVCASSLLLSEMERNPSVLGICTAFTQACEKLEEAFVQWCSVAGQFFSDPISGSTSLVKRSNSAPAGPTLVAGETSRATLTKRVGSWGKKMHPITLTIDDITSIVTRNPKQKSRLKPLVRDLAILPTQRITRYVLLFKDLETHSPLSDVRVTIEHAANAAVTLARKADEAQNHPAFRVISPV